MRECVDVVVCGHCIASARQPRSQSLQSTSFQPSLSSSRLSRALPCTGACPEGQHPKLKRVDLEFHTRTLALAPTSSCGFAKSLCRCVTNLGNTSQAKVKLCIMTATTTEAATVHRQEARWVGVVVGLGSSFSRKRCGTRKASTRRGGGAASISWVRAAAARATVAAQPRPARGALASSASSTELTCVCAGRVQGVCRTCAEHDGA